MYAVAKLGPKNLIPTHAGDREYLYEEFAERAGEEGLDVSVHYPENRGDSFLYRGGAVLEFADRR